jgi:nitroimidazol reductase NimA-like FMN-containing flavoprotein (pyridoxamine 5'-phosphate oxidase superfamily)
MRRAAVARRLTVEEREAFLADAHLGVLSIADVAGRAPLAVPMWYLYQPGGDVGFITARDSRKAGLIRKAGRVSLCAQTADYRYVTVEGPVVSVQDTVTVDERKALARRYLGEADADLYIEATAAETQRMSAFWMRPERWLAADQTAG